MDDKLVKLFEEYVLYFEEKRHILTSFSRPERKDSFGLEVVQIEKFTKRVLSQIKSDSAETKLISMILDGKISSKIKGRDLKQIRIELRELKVLLDGQLELVLKIKDLHKWYGESLVAFNKTTDGVIEGDKEGKNQKQVDQKRVDSYEEFLSQYANRCQKLKSLLMDSIQREHSILFEEEKHFQNIKQKVLSKLRFPVVDNVEYFKTAILANKYFASFCYPRLNIGYIKRIPKKYREKQCNLVYYPGSFDDPVVIFCFPNAKLYVLQDPQKCLGKLIGWFNILQRVNIVQNLKMESNTFTFRFNGETKRLKIYDGKRGDVTRFIPNEVKKFGADVLMGKAFTVNDKIKNKFLGEIFSNLNSKCLISEWFRVDNNFRLYGYRHVNADWWIKRE